MATRKKDAPPADTTPEVSAAEPSPEPEPAPAPPAPLPVSAPVRAPEPVRTFKAPTPAPVRCGGYVLTERGWEIDTATPEQET